MEPQLKVIHTCVSPYMCACGSSGWKGDHERKKEILKEMINKG